MHHPLSSTAISCIACAQFHNSLPPPLPTRYLLFLPVSPPFHFSPPLLHAHDLMKAYMFLTIYCIHVKIYRQRWKNIISGRIGCSCVGNTNLKNSFYASLELRHEIYIYFNNTVTKKLSSCDVSQRCAPT